MYVLEWACGLQDYPVPFSAHMLQALTFIVSFVHVEDVCIACVQCVCVFLKRSVDLLLISLSAENQNCRVGWKDYQATDCECSDLCQHHRVSHTNV